MRISYNKRLDQFYVVVDEAYYEESRIVGVFDANALILAPTTEKIMFTEEDIIKLCKFMENLDSVKVCEAEDCRNKFVPGKSNQQFCSTRCRMRIAAQKRRSEQKKEEKENASQLPPLSGGGLQEPTNAPEGLPEGSK